jgi:hypothetical protein
MFEPIQLIPIIENKEISYQDILKYRILPSDTIPVPDVALSFFESMVMTRKNISCVTGKAKVGKTFLLTILNMAMLHKGEFQNTLKSYLPKGKDKILYIDTEQSDYHILLILKRILDSVGENKIDNLLMFNFDAIDIEQRRNYTRDLIYNTEGLGVVIIDGIADLIYDTNDIKESSIMASDLRKWSVERDIHIINVLHQNPSENSKMRGHLGTILMNKSETVIQITSDKENESIKIVETLSTRNKKPLPFAFEISEDGAPEIIDYVFSNTPTKKRTKKELFELYKIDILNDIFGSSKDLGLGRGEFEDKFRRSFLSKTAETVSEMYAKVYSKDLIETSYVFKNQEDSKYYLGNVIENQNDIF